MPELPDLEVIRRRLDAHLPGVSIESVQVVRPIIVRNLLGGEVATHIVGHSFRGVQRRGKYLILPLDNSTSVVIHPMLAGRLRYGTPLPKHRTRDALVLGLSSGDELRYHDAAGMGKIYVTDNLDRVPGLTDQGPEATDPQLTLEVFRQRLQRHYGEIKGILTDSSFVAGIGNAYSDEICWRAQVYPFRRRASLNENEVISLHKAMQNVLAEAIVTLEQRMVQEMEAEERDFLMVHRKAGQPCPRCGSPISEVVRQKRSTCFCRTCQPGLMVAGKDRRLQ